MGRDEGRVGSVSSSPPRQPLGIRFYPHPRTLPPISAPNGGRSLRGPVPAGNIVIPSIKGVYWVFPFKTKGKNEIMPPQEKKFKI